MTYETHLTVESPHKLVLENLPFQAGQHVKIVIVVEDDPQLLGREVEAELDALIGVATREGEPEPPLIAGKSVSEYADLYLYGVGAASQQ